MVKRCPCCGSHDLTTLGAMELATGQMHVYQWGCENCRAIVQFAGNGSQSLECIPLAPGQEWCQVSYDLSANPPAITENRQRVWRG